MTDQGETPMFTAAMPMAAAYAPLAAVACPWQDTCS